MATIPKLSGDATGFPLNEDLSRVSRRVFSDPAIFDREMERIFARNWLYLAHDSELPGPGDYVTRPMGSDQVILTRGDDGQVRGFLNSCSHRGMPLCRADAGRTKRFVCPYHSWTFDTKGELRTTSYDENYVHINRADHGLTPVPRLETFHGLIFGNWDPDAGSLDAHLGDLKWYLEILFARTPGGMSVIGAPQRWVMETNWKIPALNFIDSQHAPRTHAGPMAMAEAGGAPPLSAVLRIAAETPQVVFPEGHGIVLAPWPKMGLPPFFGYPPEVVPLYEDALSPAQYEQFRNASPAVGTIFPNTSWVESLATVDPAEPPRLFLSLRNWQPIGPDRIEIWSWYFGEVEASDESRARIERLGLQTFGVGGIFEEDDAEVWSCIARSLKGRVSAGLDMDFSAGLDHRPMENFSGPGTAYPSQMTEHAQFSFMRRWQQDMREDGR